MTPRRPDEVVSVEERREFLRRMVRIAEDHADGRISDERASHELKQILRPIKARARRWARRRAAGEA